MPEKSPFGAIPPVTFSLPAFLLFVALLLPRPAPGATYHVTVDGSGTGDGSSWQNAFDEARFIERLPSALSGDIFLLAAGSYRPSRDGDRFRSFPLVDGVALYGGYGLDDQGQAVRDPTHHKTILTGEIQGDGSETNNSYHVLTGDGIGASTLLDGLTIADGQANGIESRLHQGGGLHLRDSSPAVIDCAFGDNGANSGGGALFSEGGSPSFRDCRFIANKAVNTNGGALYVLDGSLLLDSCLLTLNEARLNGGALFGLRSTLTLTDCTVSDNSALGRGGGLFVTAGDTTLEATLLHQNGAALSGGGLYGSDDAVLLVNVTLSANRSGQGGGLYLHEATLKIVNATFTGNEGKALHLMGTTALIVNSLFFDNGETAALDGASATFLHCITEEEREGPGTFAADPLLEPLADGGGKTWTHGLHRDSPAIDSAIEGGPLLSGDITIPRQDQRGIVRPQGQGFDRGAFEAVPEPEEPPPPPPSPPPEEPAPSPPLSPRPLSPQDGAAGLPLTPRLRTAPYSHPEGLAHGTTQWQLRPGGPLAATATAAHQPCLYDRDSALDLVELLLPEGLLAFGRPYSWRSRFSDSRGRWSAWAPWCSFTTEEAPEETDEEEAEDDTAPAPPGGCRATSASALLLLGALPRWLRKKASCRP